MDDSLGPVELGFLKPANESDEDETKEYGHPPPDPPPPLRRRHEAGSDGCQVRTDVGCPDVDGVHESSLVHKEDVCDRHLDHSLGKRPYPALHGVDAPPVSSGLGTGGPDHDGHLGSAAEDVDGPQTVLQSEGDEHEASKGESGTADGISVVPAAMIQVSTQAPNSDVSLKADSHGRAMTDSSVRYAHEHGTKAQLIFHRSPCWRSGIELCKRHHGIETGKAKVQIFAPCGPVERIVGVVGRTRLQEDLGLGAGSSNVLKPLKAHRPGREFRVIDPVIPHGNGCHY